MGYYPVLHRICMCDRCRFAIAALDLPRNDEASGPRDTSFGTYNAPPHCSVSEKRTVMKSQIVGLRVASVIFGFVCLAHVVRLWAGWEVTVGVHHFGHTPSLFA